MRRFNVHLVINVDFEDGVRSLIPDGAEQPEAS